MILIYTLIALAAILLLLFHTSRFFRWWIKRITFVVSFLLLNITGVFVALARPLNVATNSTMMFILRQTINRLFGFTVSVRGKEHLNEKTPAIYVCNHISSLDLVPMSAVWPKNTAILGKRELRYVPFLGQYFYLAGNVFIDRGHVDKAKSTMDKTAHSILERNINVWVFPEGTRNREGGLLPFKKGAFHLAIQCQIPIIPICLHRYDPIYNSVQLNFESGEFDVTVLPAVPTKGLTSDDVGELAVRVREMMIPYCLEAANVTAVTNSAPSPKKTPSKPRSKKDQ